MPTPRKATHLISRAEMARRLDVTPSGVTRACRPRGRLHAACEGRAINVMHEDARRWLAQRVAVTQDLPPLPVEQPGPATPASAQTPQTAASVEADLGIWRAQIDLESLVEPLTLLTEKYGEHREFEKWIGARKSLAQARKEEMAQARLAGKLIARTTVLKMISAIDVSFRLLLIDVPRSVATRVAPDNMLTVSAIIRDAMEQILKAAKAQLVATLEADDPNAPLLEAIAAE